MPPAIRRQHSPARHQYFAVLFSFAALGFHVGVWAVQLAELAAVLRLSPGALGLALAMSAAAGLVTLFTGGCWPTDLVAAQSC